MMDRTKRWSRGRAVAAVIAALCLNAARGPLSAQQTELARYFFGGRPMSLTVHLDSIGVFAPTLTPGQIEDIILPAGLSAGRWIGQTCFQGDH